MFVLKFHWSFVFCLVADYVADTKNCTVIPAGDLNAGLCAGSMYYQAVADVDCNMSAIVYDIAGTHIAGAYSSNPARQKYGAG